jgi:hypothetical protein
MPDQNSSSSRFLRQKEEKQPSGFSENSLIDRFVGLLIGVGILAGAFYAAWGYPTAPLLICAGLLLYLLLLLKYPPVWLIVIPAAIPLLELGFWSGKVYFSEFDLLLLVTVGGGLMPSENLVGRYALAAFADCRRPISLRRVCHIERPFPIRCWWTWFI